MLNYKRSEVLEMAKEFYPEVKEKLLLKEVVRLEHLCLARGNSIITADWGKDLLPKPSAQTFSAIALSMLDALIPFIDGNLGKLLRVTRTNTNEYRVEAV